MKKTAVVVAGGRGTRLRPYNLILPKPLIPVGDQPVLKLILERLVSCGFTDLHICLGQYSELIKAACTRWDVEAEKFHFHVEKSPLGTVGALTLIPDADLPDNFVVCNADIVTDVDFGELFEQHCLNGNDLTLASVQKPVSIAYGVIGLSGGSRMRSFTEKPVRNLDVNIGVYAVEKAVLRHIPSGSPYGIDNLVKRLLSKSGKVCGYRHYGQWGDVGDSGLHQPAHASMEATWDTSLLGGLRT